MKPIDFEYDGQYLSDYGFIVCEFDASGGISEASAYSDISFVKVPRNNGSKFSLTNTKYAECLSAQIDICKNPDIYDNDEMKITIDEFREIVRWLSKKRFYPLRFVADDNDTANTESCYYNASFNISKLTLGGVLYGIRLYMETDMPCGYGEKRVISWNAAQDNLMKVIDYESDEMGYIYPDITITLKEDCDFVISNESENCNSVVLNCSAGEVITMHGDTNIITSSYDKHDICNDFNYDFFRIGKDVGRTENVIVVSHPCDVVINYCPMIKYTEF